jgi:hypothetical protein
VGRDDVAIGQKRTQNLDRLLILEMVEPAAQHFSIEGNKPFLTITVSQEVTVLSETLFDFSGGCTLNDSPDGGVSGQPFPIRVKDLVEYFIIGLDKGTYFPVGSRSTQNGEYRKE